MQPTKFIIVHNPLVGELPFERYHSILQHNVIKDEPDDVPESFQEVTVFRI